MAKKSKRQRTYSPRSPQTKYALYLTGLLGFASVRQLCLLVWENERRTNANLKTLLDNHFLHQAHETVNPTEGRSNRIVFLTRSGAGYLLEQGFLRNEDVAFHWKGDGAPHPQYNLHNLLIHDVLSAFIKQANEQAEASYDIRLDPLAPATSDTDSSATPLADGTLIPDRVFALKAGEHYVHCYLEVDRGTEDKRQWQQKMEKYLASPEILNQAWVRVLIVAHAKRRMDTLMRWSTHLVNDRFLFSHQDRVCYQYERQDAELVLTTCGNPFGAIWQTVNEEADCIIFD